MTQPFIQTLTFQIKPDKTEEFEALWQAIAPKLAAQPGLKCPQKVRQIFLTQIV